MARPSHSVTSSEPAGVELSRQFPNAGGAGQDGNAVECCVICLEAISEPCRAEPCSHDNFDFVCLASWVELKSTCPLCKAEVSRIHYTPIPGADGGKNPPGVYAVPAKPTRPSRAEPSVSADHRYSSSRPHTSWSERRRRRREPIPALPSPDLGLGRRRTVYRHRLFSLHIGANRINRYSDVTPEIFTNAPHRVSRARMWIRRELQVFDFLERPSPSSEHQARRGADPLNATRRIDNAEFLLEYIIAILKSVDIQGSAGQAEEMLSEFLGRDNTRLFLHELRSWLRSPHSTLAQWDREMQYPEATPSTPAPPRGNDDAPSRPPRGDCWRPSRQDSSQKRKRNSSQRAGRSPDPRPKLRRDTSPA